MIAFSESNLALSRDGRQLEPYIGLKYTVFQITQLQYGAKLAKHLYFKIKYRTNVASKKKGAVNDLNNN